MLTDFIIKKTKYTNLRNLSNLSFPKASFDGRVYLRQDYRKNRVFDDVSHEFNGIGQTFRASVGGANTTVITGGHLTVTDNILGGSDEDKTFFADVSSKEISIGSGTSKVIMNSTNHMKVPVGTTAQRIANGVGAIRYNTTDDCLEVCHDNTTWTEVPLLKW